MKIFIALVGLFMCGCNHESTRDSQYVNDDKTTWGANIITVDSCEYVVYISQVSGCAMVHSGNCHNPNHKK